MIGAHEMCHTRGFVVTVAAKHTHISSTFANSDKVESFFALEPKPKQNESDNSRCGNRAVARRLDDLSMNSPHYLDYLERIKRCNVTVSQLASGVLEAKRKAGRSQPE